MSVVLESRRAAAEHVSGSIGLFRVWFDTNCGSDSPDWWWEEPGPMPLADALKLAAQLRAGSWICIVAPEGANPRPDGRWDNPA